MLLNKERHLRFSAGGVKKMLLAIWFCGNRSMAKGASEDRLAHFVDLLEADTAVPTDCLPAAMDDRDGWRKKARGGWLRST